MQGERGEKPPAVEIRDLRELGRIIKEVRRVAGVQSVERV